MISAMSETEHVVRCLVIGATITSPSPSSPSCSTCASAPALERHRWRQQEQKYLRQLEEERSLSERLLLNILPKPIAARLRQGEDVIVDALPDVTLLAVQVLPFPPTDAASATPPLPPPKWSPSSTTSSPTFDPCRAMAGRENQNPRPHLPRRRRPHPAAPDHAYTVVDLALALQRAVAALATSRQRPLPLRIGIHTGPVIAGLIGLHKFSYDLWGDTVHLATHLATTAPSDRIQVSPATELLLRDRHRFEPREIEIPGQGMTTTYFLLLDSPSL